MLPSVDVSVGQYGWADILWLAMWLQAHWAQGTVVGSKRGGGAYGRVSVKGKAPGVDANLGQEL